MPGLASSLHATGATDQAVRLVAATETLRRRTGHCHLLPARRYLHERTIAAARQTLDNDSFRHAWTDGAELTYDELIHASTASGG